MRIRLKIAAAVMLAALGGGATALAANPASPVPPGPENAVVVPAFSASPAER